jgi:uncharacterized protein YndB with AHSA1/START domain/quinol monooxygenase YgiN
MSKETALFVRHRAKPGQRDDVRRVWEKHVKPRAAANSAHLAYYFCFDTADPDVVCVFQLYTSEAAMTEFLAGAWYPDYLAEIAAVVAEPPHIMPASVLWAKPFAPAGKSTLHSTRLLTATRSAIFAAIADPARIARWWGPNGFTNTIHHFDFRPGGEWLLDMHGPDGTVYPNESRFVAIVPDERVVIEHLREVHHFLLDIRLIEEPGGTRIHWSMTFDSEQECERSKAYAPRCNEELFDRLEAELRRNA